MSESSNNPVDGGSGIGKTISTALRQPSILRVMLGLAATVVVLVGMRLAAPILNPILFALVLALLFSPIYAWLTRHRIPTPLALVIMLVLAVFAIPVLVLIGLYAAVPQRASIMLRSLQAWMGKNNRAITVALCFVLGTFFLLRGLLGS